MRTNPFESQLERLARTLTERFGVRVVCHGDQAFTDGKTIVLPSLPDPMDPPLERMVVGFLDHEMGHVAFSDFKVVEEFGTNHPGYESMLNVVEDALVERKAMQRWPGVRSNLDAMLSQIRDRIMAKLRNAGPFHRFACAVYFKLSHHRDMLGLEHEIAGYEDLLAGFPAAQDTRDAAVLAGQLLQHWMSRHPRKGGTPQGSSTCPRDDKAERGSSASSEGTESHSSGTNQNNGEDASPDDDSPPRYSEEVTEDGPEADSDHDNSDSESPGSASEELDASEANTSDAGGAEDDALDGKEDADPKECSDDSDTPGNHDGATAADGAAEQQPTESDSVAPEDSQEPSDDDAGCVTTPGAGGTLIGEVLAEAIRECMAQLSGSDEYRMFSKERDRIETVPAATDAEVKDLLARHTDTVRRLRRGLANALRSAEKRWWRDEQAHGNLSPRTLHRLCLDQPRLDVFRTRAMVQGRSTAVSLVLDASGSMTTHKMEVARDAMRALLQALADLKVTTEAFTFTTGNSLDLNQIVQATGQDVLQLRERYSRFSNLEIGLIKTFEEPVKYALRRLPRVRGTGLTPLGEAMEIGARRLIVRPESRKILLVLTDGRAGCEGSSIASHLHAQRVAKKIAGTGIELVGVGIQDETLREVVEDTIVVQKLEDLPAQLCKLLGRTLKKGLRHVG